MSWRDRSDTPTDIKELKDKNLSVQCPYCRITVSAIPVTEPIADLGHDNLFFVAQCPNHKQQGKYCKPFFAVYNVINDQILERYPVPRYDKSNYHESIPENIRKDFAESMCCYGAYAYKGATTLCRRTIEAVCYDKLANKIKPSEKGHIDLKSLIDRLKNEGLITDTLKQAAHAIRLLGNYGAHFKDDGIENVEYKEAKEIQEYTFHLLETLYIIPYKTTSKTQTEVD
jgi:hypothetical protein